MVRLIKGDIVVIPFPFSDLSSTKRRPALVITTLKGDDIILCQITGKQLCDDYSINLSNEDFEDGSLNKDSNIRPNRLFTTDKSIISYKAGKIYSKKLEHVINKIIEILK